MRRILGVWAHPDDELFGPVGTVCVGQAHGYDSAVIIATHGEAGSAANANLAAGQTLDELRIAELRSAVATIGIAELVLWSYPDGKLHEAAQPELVAKIAAEIERWQPSIVLTFGPDGVTGHPDHIAISVATTQAFHRCRAGGAGPQRLLYITLPPNAPHVTRMGDAPAALAANTVIDGAQFADVKRRALACHASQRADWELQLGRTEWLTTDHFFQAFPAYTANVPQTTIFDDLAS